MADRPELELRLNALPLEAAREVLTRCCGAARWVEGMLAQRPFASRSAVLGAAADVWAHLNQKDYLEAFAHHPEIGADLEVLRNKFAATADWASAEQSGAANASEATLCALRDGNAAYRRHFGYSFIVCATGKSAQQMLDLLNARLDHSPEQELACAAAEQAKITHLRLEKLEP
ncbi:MAG TPA: 2-oxo-4-hydroxy-4-carboxy-5-ureidoimidazoline decarboxylase [Polyangiaceae bacterium]